MKNLWVLLFVLPACSAKPAQNCTMVARESRPSVTITWKVEHGSLDEDPPRAKVSLVFGGVVTSTVQVGQLTGNCKLADVGTLPDAPANGSKVTEIECVHGIHGEYATVFLTEPGKLVVRRYERLDDKLRGHRDLQTIETPTCAVYATDVATGGDL